jgi:mRNA interferase RelE/StbE
MYEVFYSKQVEKFFLKHKDIKKLIIKTFKEIKNCPFEKIIWDKYDLKKMKGNENLYRLRVRDYRVIFDIQNDKLIIFLIKVDNRGQVYK